MIEFLSLNSGTIFVGVLVLAIVISIVVKLARDKRNGKSIGCGYGCSECHHSANCNSK